MTTQAICSGRINSIKGASKVRILVTGGAGYIGSHAVRLLIQAGHEVWVYDNLGLGHRRAVPEGRLIVGDLLDRARLESALREHRIEAVMHFAAFALVGESVADPAKYYQNNVGGSLSLLEAMRAAGVKQIVFSSTTATYGAPKKVPITEDELQFPINPYGFTKLVIERALADYAHAYGFAYAALRYFNAAGASPEGDIGEDHDPESHLIPIVLQVALGQRDQVAIFGDDYPTPDGTCIRDYIHIDDLGDAHIRALELLAPGQGLKLNLGIGRGYSVKEVIDACRRITGHKIPASMGPRRPGDPPELIANSTLAQKTLGWNPKYTDIETIVATAWKWHQSHPHGYGDRV
jgi:UDP-glucose 4-epimerase